MDEDLFLEIGIDDQEYERLKDSDEDFFGPENETQDVCEELDIPYLNLYPIFLDFDEEERMALYDDEDWHLSAVGNQIAGDLVASTLVRPQLFKNHGRPGEGRRSWL